MMTQCPLCGFEPLESLIARSIRVKSWAESPAPWLGGLTPSELARLDTAGMARRLPSGWWIPTDTGKVVTV